MEVWTNSTGHNGGSGGAGSRVEVVLEQLVKEMLEVVHVLEQEEEVEVELELLAQWITSGGQGLASSITGSSVTRAGGGGGG